MSLRLWAPHAMARLRSSLRDEIFLHNDMICACVNRSSLEACCFVSASTVLDPSLEQAWNGIRSRLMSTRFRIERILFGRTTALARIVAAPSHTTAFFSATTLTWLRTHPRLSLESTRKKNNQSFFLVKFGVESSPIVETGRRRSDGGFKMSAKNPDSAPPKRIVTFRGSNFAAIIPGDSVVEAVVTQVTQRHVSRPRRLVMPTSLPNCLPSTPPQGISSFLGLYNSAIIVRLILTWFPNPPAALVGPLATVTDPYLNIFRGIIPPLGGTIDLSPILAFICLDFFSSSAAALPSERPSAASAQGVTRGGVVSSLSRMGPALQRRLEATRARREAARKEVAAKSE